MVQRHVSYMAENKNYRLLKIVFFSTSGQPLQKNPKQTSFHAQSLVIPKQILKTVFSQLMVWLFKRGFLQFPCKLLFHPQNKH